MAFPVDAPLNMNEDLPELSDTYNTANNGFYRFKIIENLTNNQIGETIEFPHIIDNDEQSLVTQLLIEDFGIGMNHTCILEAHNSSTWGNNNIYSNDFENDPPSDSFNLIWESEEASGLYGDVDIDGLVNVVDVIVLIQHILNINLLPPESMSAADLNGDGLINVVDITMVIVEILTD